MFVEIDLRIDILNIDYSCLPAGRDYWHVEYLVSRKTQGGSDCYANPTNPVMLASLTFVIQKFNS